MEWFHVHLKNADIDGNRYEWKKQRSEEQKYEDIVIHLEHQTQYPKEQPHALGMEFRVDRGIDVRLKQDKVDKLPDFEHAKESVDTPASGASMLGRIMYHNQLYPIAPAKGTTWCAFCRRPASMWPTTSSKGGGTPVRSDPDPRRVENLGGWLR